MSQSQKLLALLIDGDNVSSKQIQEILDKASTAGKLLIKRVYVNKASMAQWESVINQHSLTPFWVSNNTTNKNSVDIALVVDAMTLLYERPDLTGFCLVSSDSDFTVLARHILTKDKYVLGLGQSSTPQAFRNACSKFVNLNLPVKKVELPKATVTKKPPAKNADPPKTSGTKKALVQKVQSPKAAVSKPTTAKKVEPPKTAVSKPTVAKNSKPPPAKVAKELPNSALEVLVAKAPIQEGTLLIRSEVVRLRYAYERAAKDAKVKDGWLSLSIMGDYLRLLYPEHDPLSYKGVKSSGMKKTIERMIADYPQNIEIAHNGQEDRIRVR